MRRKDFIANFHYSAVAKITGKEGLQFKGKARVFETEDALVKAIEDGTFKKGEKVVMVLRYMGPKGGPGMPEMLKVKSIPPKNRLFDLNCFTKLKAYINGHGSWTRL